MSQPFAIVGAEGTGVHPRIELRDLQKKPVQFSLFIRALTKVQDNSPNHANNPESWWQIGAIHGLPYTPYTGDPKGPQNPDRGGSGYLGYCYHASALFPPWHRVLLLLIEQAMVKEAIAIATDLEAKNPAARTEGWLKAAKELRFPFWDWTRPETAKEGIPQVCQQTTVTIVNPGGATTQVPNPLNHYKYAGGMGGDKVQGLEYMDTWPRTYRWVDKDLNPTKEQYDLALKAFAEGGKLNLGGDPIDLQPVTWLREKIAGLFSYDLTLKDPAYGPNMWGYFSNTGAETDGVEPPMSVMPSSIEEPHNMVHVDVGGNGSMSANEYASFDPMFFLHHSNVDRIYAFWEYLYPEYWIGDGWKNSKTGQVTPFLTDQGTFWQDKGAKVDHSTPYHPFRNKSQNYWTSDDVRGLLNTRAINLYYTYPPIVDPITGTKVQVDVPYNVKDLALRQQYQRILHSEWGKDLVSVSQTHMNLPFSLPFLDLIFKVEAGLTHLTQFIIVGRLPEFAFRGSYRLELYLLPKIVQLATGALKAASGVFQQVTGLGVFQQASQALEEVAIHVVNNITVLGRSDVENCAACKDRRASGSHVRGYMHIDPRIILYLISSLDPTQLANITQLDHLALLVHGSFGVRLVKPDGTKIAAAEPDIATGQSPLEDAQVPKLSLHSRVIKYNADDLGAPLQFGTTATHGAFAASHGWKAL